MRLIITVILLLTIGSKANSQNQMTLITSKERVRINLTGSGNAEICWGDGQKSKYRRLPSKYNDFNDEIHTYSDSTARTITIVGNDIRILSCYGNQLTYLDVSKNNALKILYCGANQLTNLDLTVKYKLLIN